MVEKIAMSELVEWHRVDEVLPDSDETVLVVESGNPEVLAGYLDGDVWRDVEGFRLDTVLFWAVWPCGPVQ